MVNFNLYQAKATDGEDKDKEEEIFIDLEDGPEKEEEVKDGKMQNNNFVEAKREEWSVQSESERERESESESGRSEVYK